MKEEKKEIYMEKSLYKDKSMWLSMIASWLSFILNFGVSFYLTPYLIRSIGETEYSFYPLASSFISYISVVTIALNSMQSRFVVIALHRKETKKAMEYINAVFFSNLIFSIFLLPIGIFFIFNIDKFLNVPIEVKTNVQILFSFVLFSLIVGLLTNFYSMSTYYKDKLYLGNFASMVSILIKVGIGILLFSLLPAKVYYVSIMDLATFIVGLGFGIYFTKKFMPDITISYKYFRIDRVKELMSSGIWNSVSSLSNMLLTGIDLLLANIYLGPTSVAMISISKALPNQVCALISVAGNIFQPRFARQYAHNDINALYNSLKSSIRLLGLVACIPMGALLTIGLYFFKLWIPSMDARTLQILSIMAVSTLCISITIQPIYSIFIITNKVKLNSLVVLGTSILNILLVILLLRFTDVQFYRMVIIVFTSEIIGITRNLFFTIPYAAKCIGVNWIDFFKVVLRNMALLGMCIIVYYLLSLIVIPNSWIMFVLIVIIGAIVSIILLWFIAINKNEREILKKVVFTKLKIKS